MRMTLPHSTEGAVNFTLDLLRRNEFKSDVYIRPLLYTLERGDRRSLHNSTTAFHLCRSFGNYVEK